MSGSRDITTGHTFRFAGRCIEATVTSEAAAADDWVKTVLSVADTPMLVGLDCEWRPYDDGERPNKVAVLQLCAGNRCLVLQLRHMPRGAPAGVMRFFQRNDVTFVGVGVKQDVDKLADEYGIMCRNYEDLEEPSWNCMESMGSSVAFLGRRRLGLKGYAQAVLGIQMEKPMSVTRSDWEVRTLSKDQIEYACIDAYVSYALGSKLLSK